MRFVTIKNVRNGLTLVWRKRGDIDKRFYALFVNSCNHCTRIGVSGYNDRTSRPGNRPVQGNDIVAQ
jgi:hypothetical protein